MRHSRVFSSDDHQFRALLGLMVAATIVTGCAGVEPGHDPGALVCGNALDAPVVGPAVEAKPVVVDLSGELGCCSDAFGEDGCPFQGCGPILDLDIEGEVRSVERAVAELPCPSMVAGWGACDGVREQVRVTIVGADGTEQSLVSTLDPGFSEGMMLRVRAHAEDLWTSLVGRVEVLSGGETLLWAVHATELAEAEAPDGIEIGPGSCLCRAAEACGAWAGLDVAASGFGDQVRVGFDRPESLGPYVVHNGGVYVQTSDRGCLDWEASSANLGLVRPGPVEVW
jgi:hypothetical protein